MRQKSTPPRKYFSESPLAPALLPMQADRVPSRAPTLTDIFHAYAAVLPNWLRRFKVPASDATDVMQEVWLAFCSGTVKLPSSISEARLELFKITRVVAQRLRRAQAREEYLFVPHHDHRPNDPDVPMRQHMPRPTDDIDEQELAMFKLGLFEAFERLSPKYRQLACEYYVIGYTIKEMAQRAGIKEDRMEKWVWRVSAELQRLWQKGQRAEERNKKRQNGALLVPFAFDLDSATRAAFCSIWEAEGDPVQTGGGGTSPPPSSVPPIFPIAPILSGMTGAVVAAVAVAILAVMLVLFPAGIVALHYFWNPPHIETAQTGLRVPPMPEVGVIEDIVPLYPKNLPTVSRAPARVAPPARIVHTPLDKTVHGASNGLPSERLAGD